MVFRLLLAEGVSQAAVIKDAAAGPETFLPSVDRGESLAVGALVGIILGAVFAAVIAFVVVWYIQRRLRSDSPDDENFLENLAGLPPRFPYKDLQHATNNFGKNLGGGGFATVYEGTLSNGVKIAVKKLNRQIGSQDFRAEVATVGGIHHVNLIRLLGFCAQGAHRLLVYEFMPNGSLDKWIFPEESADGNHQNNQVLPTKFLDWHQRFNIAVGTARGLAYLHDECAKRIIHFDIKPQNILLDEHLVPKVADFGLSKSAERDVGSEVMVTTVRGTPGYVAPEWLLGVAITEKGDVYSYGLVLFEIIGGRKNLDPSDKAGNVSYFPATCLKEVIEKGFAGALRVLLDPRLNYFDEQQAERMLKVAFWCIQESPEARPNMREIVLMLEGKLEILEPPSISFHGLHQRIQTLEREKLQRMAFGDSTITVVNPSAVENPSSSFIDANTLKVDPR
ncbi:unnamed protein product [Calypogeia fissa]